MVLCDLKILDTLQAKYSVMYCSGGKKVTPPEKNGRLCLPKNLACCTGFSLNCCENDDGIVNGRDSSSGRTDAPKESAYGACSANVPHQVCACLPWGLSALRPWAEGRFGTVYTT